MAAAATAAASSLHNSFGRQPEILETYIYAASLVPEERRGKRDERETVRPGGRLYKRAERPGGGGGDTTGGDAEGMGREMANSRNQDDKRRVGAVMHDAQIRAIVPITVQIIVREPTRRVASVQTQPATSCPGHNGTDARLISSR